MITLSDAKEKWAGAINALAIGATAQGGGTRTSTVTVGGANSLPFMHYEGQTPNRPAIAMEIWDREPDEWADPLMAALGDAVRSPADWARRSVEEWGADLICLKLMGTHPDLGDRSPDEAAGTVRDVLGAVGVPLIIWGSENDEKDNEVMPRCSQAAAGEKCLMGIATESNYKTLVAACQADGHCLINQSPIDINIAKQVNILVSEMGFPLDRVVMYETTGALGYGMEYVYSIQERSRLAALSGDKMMALPIICMVGQEAWRVKEAKASAEEQPTWGDAQTRGVIWELATASALLQAGSDIIVVRHPATAQALRRVIDSLVV
jgi:acetyl-CoA decarbonylase/synthase complex subunit delta